MATPFYVGVDIAHKTFEAAICPADAPLRLGQFANDASGFQALAQQLAGVVPADHQLFLVLEPTGGYELALVAFGYEQGWQICLPNPRVVHDWIQGEGRRGKTDRQDAAGLAKYGHDKHPAPQHSLPAPLQELAELLHRQEDLEQLLRAERNRRHALAQHPRPSRAVTQSLERTIEALQQELTQIEQAIHDLSDDHPDLKGQARLLQSVPGVGRKNVWPLLLLLYRWQARAGQAADKKGLVAFAGLDPEPHQSGTSVYQPPLISHRGDRRVRALLFMGALGGVRGRNPLRAFYRRLVGRGKAKRLALVAAGRKILIWAWCVFCQGAPFDPARHPIPEALSA